MSKWLYPLLTVLTFTVVFMNFSPRALALDPYSKVILKYGKEMSKHESAEPSTETLEQMKAIVYFLQARRDFVSAEDLQAFPILESVLKDLRELGYQGTDHQLLLQYVIDLE